KLLAGPAADVSNEQACAEYCRGAGLRSRAGVIESFNETASRTQRRPNVRYFKEKRIVKGTAIGVEAGAYGESRSDIVIRAKAHTVPKRSNVAGVAETAAGNCKGRNSAASLKPGIGLRVRLPYEIGAGGVSCAAAAAGI